MRTSHRLLLLGLAAMAVVGAAWLAKEPEQPVALRRPALLAAPSALAVAQPTWATQPVPGLPQHAKSPTRDMAVLREQWLSQGNYRARVHEALSSGDAVGLRMALEADAYCVSAPMLAHFKNPPEGASQSMREAWARLSQRCTGDNARRLDDQQRGAVRALLQRLRDSDERLLSYAERESTSDAQWQRVVAQHDGDLALLFGYRMGSSEQVWLKVVGNDPLLAQAKPSVVQLAWSAETCQALGCQTENTMLDLCMMSRLCTQSSYVEQLDALAAQLGASPDDWARIRRAMAHRVQTIFSRG